LVTRTLFPIGGKVSTRTIGRIHEALQSCQFVREDAVLCHMKTSETQGWLWTLNLATGLSPAQRVRQLTRGGGAVAYALSPDQRQVAYVGSGRADSPVTLYDLESGASKELVLQEFRGCDGPENAALLYWLQDQRLLARGYCVSAIQVLGPRPTNDAVVQAKGRPKGGPGSGKGRRVAKAGDFWTPKY
jgi:hypothetical protein